MSSTTPPTPGGATPPEPTPATGNPPGGGATPPSPPTLTLEEALKALETERHARENATQERDRQRARLTELEAKQKAADEASMTELQKEQAGRAEAERKLNETLIETQQLRVHQAVSRASSQLGIIDPDVAARLIWDQVTYDDRTGQPQNIDALLTQLAKDKPYLVGKPAPTAGGASNPPRSSQSGDETGPITAEYYARVTASNAEFDKLSPTRKQQIAQWIANRARSH